MATYYATPNGKSSNSGTSIGSPWSIDHALGQLSAGDTLNLQGTFTESITISCTGTEVSPITIQGYGTGAVFEGTWDSWQEFMPSGTVADYWSYAKARIKPEHAPPGAKLGDADGIVRRFVNGKERLHYDPMILFRGADWVIVDDVEIHSHWSRGVQFDDSRDCTFKNGYIHHIYESGVKMNEIELDDGSRSEAVRCKVEDTELAWCSLRGYFRIAGLCNNHPVNLSGTYGTNCEFTRCTVHHGGGEGIGAGQCGKGIVIDSCIVYDQQTVHIYTDWARDATIKNCILFETSPDSPSTNPSRGFILRDEHGGDKKCTGTYSGRKSKNVKIYNNLIVGFGYGIWVSNKANLENYHIAHNTIVNCEKGFYILAMASDWSSIRTRSGTVIENNVIDCIDNTVNSKDGITFRNNIWRNSGSRPNNAKGEDDVIGGIGLIDRDDNYTFATFDKTNYYIQSSSDARGAAAASEFSRDFRGKSRGNSPDCGFVQYDSDYGTTPDPDLTAGFTLDAYQVTPATTVTITDTATIDSGAIDSWAYHYSTDGGNTWVSIGTSQNETFTPSASGTYLIRQTVTDTDPDPDDVDYASATLIVSTEDPDVDSGGTTPDGGGGGGSTSPDIAGNLLVDGDFDSGGTTNWAKSSLTMSVENGELKVHTVTTAASAQVYQSYAQSGTYIDISNATDYMIEFDARIDGKGRSMGVQVIDHGTSADCLEEQAFTVPAQDDMEHFTIGPITSVAASSDARFRIRPYALASGSTLYLDNLVLYEYVEVTAAFSADDSTPSVGQTVDFTDSSTGATSWQWYVKRSTEDDDGYDLFSTAQNPSWTVPSEGVYTVKLVAGQGNVTDETTSTLTTSDWTDWAERGMGIGLQEGTG